MSRVLVVGAGLTGSLCACLLRREMLSKVQITVWEKCHGAGGRMCTSSSPDNPNCTADLGAQYVTATSFHSETHGSFYAELSSHGILRPLVAPVEGMVMTEEGIRNFVTPMGASSIVKHYLRESEAEVFFSRQVTHVQRKGLCWEVCVKGGQAESFDAVVLTVPVPDILQLQGDVPSLIEGSLRQKLEAVSYSSRYALGLFYKAGTQINVPWAMKYFEGNSCIRFISIDDKKHNTATINFEGGASVALAQAGFITHLRQRVNSAESPSSGMSLVVHTCVTFGLNHLEMPEGEVKTLIMAELQKILPCLPEPASIEVRRWRYSQVVNVADGSLGQITLHLSPLLVCGGDGFTQSNFDGCIDSALRVIEVLKSSL